jgi:hypothetical protein
MRKRQRNKKCWIALLELHRCMNRFREWEDDYTAIEVRRYSQRKKALREWAEKCPHLNERRDIYGRCYTSVIAEECYVTEIWRGPRR